MLKRRRQAPDAGLGGTAQDRRSRDDDQSSRTGVREFARLAEEHYQAIYKLIYSYMGGDREEAEDLTVQTFEHAFAAYHGFRGEADVKTWIFRIAINLCKNKIRQKQTRRRFEAFSMDEGVPGRGEGKEMGLPPWQIADDAPSPHELVEHREMVRAVRQALSSMPEEYRTVLLLKLQDLPYKEIADILETSVEAVKSRLFRARVMLKQQVEPYLE